VLPLFSNTLYPFCTAKQSQNASELRKKALKHLKFYSRKEVAKHNTITDNWMIIDDKIYDMSDYWRVHPGGAKYFLQWAGKDATLPFRECGHTPFACTQLGTLGVCIGQVKEDNVSTAAEEFDEEMYKPIANPVYSAVKDPED